jgi:hypothetical protein
MSTSPRRSGALAGALAGTLLTACASGAPARGVPTDKFPIAWDGTKLNRPVRRARPAQQPMQAQPVEIPPTQPTIVAKADASQFFSGKLFAVLDFRTMLKGGDGESVDPIYFSNQVRTAVKHAAPLSRLMTRENVIVLLQSQGRKLEDCEGECEVDTGRLLGADLVLSGEIQRVGSKLKLSIRVHETHQGQLLGGETISGRSVDEMDDGMEPAIARLLLAAANGSNP